MLGVINKNLKPQKSRLFLCLPDRTTIAELHEAKNKNLRTNYNGIHELSFEIPFIVEKNHKFIRNSHVDIIRGHYLIRYEKGNVVDYFVIQNPTNSTSDGVEVKKVQCYLLPYELNSKIVRRFSGTKPIYSPVGSEGALNETLLKKTDWSVGYVDADIMKKYRTFDVSEQNLLEFINTLPEIFDCAIIWNTKNKTINIYKNENIGIDKGLSIEFGKYLISLDEEPDFDNVITRLYVYGNEDLSIAGKNPTGTDYIESFDYYIYPFERDENKNVLKKSNYMTDSLCHALLDYQELLEVKKKDFSNLLEQKKPFLETLLTKQNELFVLKTQLAQIEDELAVANATSKPTEELIAQKEAKLVEIGDKETEIEFIKGDIALIDTDILTLKNLISIENNFTPEQIKERNRFTREMVWSNSNIFNVDDLYEEGVKQLQKVNQPIISYKINAVDFLKVVQCQRDWDKLVIGDIVTVRYPNFNVAIKAKLISIHHDEDNNSLSLEIANAKDIKNGFMTLTDLFKKAVTTSATIDMSKYKWDLSEDNTHEIRQILENNWDAVKNGIIGGVNESVQLTRQGLIIKDPNDPMRFLVANHGVLALTNNGGLSWDHAITPEGIFAKLLVGQVILGEKLFISDENGTFEIRGNLLTVKDTDEMVRVKLGEYAEGKYGLELRSKANNSVVLDENGMLQTWQEGRTDNVDATNPLTLYIYIPEETISIKKALLRFKLLNFRAYSKGTASGGGYSSTTDSGGGIYTATEGGGGVIDTTGDTGIDVIYGWSQTEPAGDGHSHMMRTVQGHKHAITLPNHTHNFNVPSHSHGVYIPSHTHNIEYGIYKSTSASQISIHINGVNRDIELGGKFSTDKTNLDITPYLTIGQWNVIDLYSSQLGRIDATVFVQALMGY